MPSISNADVDTLAAFISAHLTCRDDPPPAIVSLLFKLQKLVKGPATRTGAVQSGPINAKNERSDPPPMTLQHSTSPSLITPAPVAELVVIETRSVPDNASKNRPATRRSFKQAPLPAPASMHPTSHAHPISSGALSTLNPFVTSLLDASRRVLILLGTGDIPDRSHPDLSSLSNEFTSDGLGLSDCSRVTSDHYNSPEAYERFKSCVNAQRKGDLITLVNRIQLHARFSVLCAPKSPKAKARLEELAALPGDGVKRALLARAGTMYSVFLVAFGNLEDELERCPISEIKTFSDSVITPDTGTELGRAITQDFIPAILRLRDAFRFDFSTLATPSARSHLKLPPTLNTSDFAATDHFFSAFDKTLSRFPPRSEAHWNPRTRTARRRPATKPLKPSSFLTVLVTPTAPEVGRRVKVESPVCRVSKRKRPISDVGDAPSALPTRTRSRRRVAGPEDTHLDDSSALSSQTLEVLAPAVNASSSAQAETAPTVPAAPNATVGSVASGVHAQLTTSPSRNRRRDRKSKSTRSRRAPAQGVAPLASKTLVNGPTTSTPLVTSLPALASLTPSPEKAKAPRPVQSRRANGKPAPTLAGAELATPEASQDALSPRKLLLRLPGKSNSSASASPATAEPSADEAGPGGAVESEDGELTTQLATPLAELVPALAGEDAMMTDSTRELGDDVSALPDAEPLAKDAMVVDAPTAVDAAEPERFFDSVSESENQDQEQERGQNEGEDEDEAHGDNGSEAESDNSDDDDDHEGGHGELTADHLALAYLQRTPQSMFYCRMCTRRSLLFPGEHIARFPPGTQLAVMAEHCWTVHRKGTTALGRMAPAEIAEAHRKLFTGE